MSRKTVAIIQSNYIPWKGYFSIIKDVDEFILYDDMQYTRRDWRNRNQIKTPQGLHWLTIPVEVKGKYFQKINETKISDPAWAEQHWKTIHANYRKARCYEQFGPMIEELYQSCNFQMLSEVNHHFITSIGRIFNIGTKITWSSDYMLPEGKTSRLVSLCVQAGATDYISGPAAKDYIEPHLFEEAGVKLHWYSYAGFPQYEQLYGDFVHGVSILDLLLNAGDKAGELLTRDNLS